MPEKKKDTETSSWARRMLRDPITQLLAEHSHLTEVQLETLLIDYLSDGFHGKHLDYETKASIRSKPQKPSSNNRVSRGAFNRSLAQARRNVTKSIFTLVLLGYLGLFETPSLMRYQDLAETIRSYTREYDKVVYQKDKPTPTHLRAIHQAQTRILEIIEALAKPQSIKPE